MEAYLDYQKGGTGGKLNDIIEDFKYVYKGQSVKAGDFVNYINGVAGKVDYGTSTGVQLGDTTISSMGEYISATVLDDNRIFIAHSYGGKPALYGMVVTIDGATITAGTDTALNNRDYNGVPVKAVTLPNGDVFVAHNFGGLYNNYLYGIVCKINGTAITAGADTEISTAAYSGQIISACLLLNGNVFIVHSSYKSYHLYGTVVTIDGTTITKGSNTVISSDTDRGHCISVQVLPNGNVFIAHSSSQYYLYGIVCTISGTSITKGTDTALSNTSYTAYRISTQLLPDGKVFIAHSYFAADDYLCGIVCAVSGTTITKGTDTALFHNVAKTGSVISTCLLPNGNVLIFHPNSSSYYLHGIIVSISDMAITKGTDTQLSTIANTAYAISPLLLNNGTIFVAHSYDASYYLYAQIWSVDYDNNIPTNHIVATEYETQVTPATESPFNAIALSSGEGGTDTEHKEQVKIAIPNVQEVIT